MNITYHLAGKEVNRALFRTFSSQCTKWLNVLDGKLAEMEAIGGELALDYIPATNSVNIKSDTEMLTQMLKEAELLVPTARKQHDPVRVRSKSAVS